MSNFKTNENQALEDNCQQNDVFRAPEVKNPGSELKRGQILMFALEKSQSRGNQKSYQVEKI